MITNVITAERLYLQCTDNVWSVFLGISIVVRVVNLGFLLPYGCFMKKGGRFSSCSICRFFSHRLLVQILFLLDAALLPCEHLLITTVFASNKK